MWEPEKSSWSAWKRRVRSTVQTSFILHLCPKSSGRITRDSQKLQTKTRHLMNCRELESDKPIHEPSLHILSFSRPQSKCRHSRVARATPSNHTQGYTHALLIIDKSDTETTCNR